MHTRSIRQRFTAAFGALIVLSLLTIPATANHSWGKYHVARPTTLTTNDPIPLNVGDNVNATWDPYLDTAISDWHASGTINLKIDLKEVPGGAGNDCVPTLERVEVCNAAYGTNGWLGIAQIWVTKFHITQGTAKMNDTYFNTASYNTPAWRQLVMCQEIAHD